MKKNIAVIEGGYSHEAEVSYKSAKTIRENLDASKFNIWQLRITHEGWFVLHKEKIFSVDVASFTCEIEQKTIAFDAAYIMIHGTPGEDGKLQGYFDMMKIPYTGCGQFPAALTFNKFFCNKALKSLGIKCANAVCINPHTIINEDDIIKEVGLPCFVKPADGGSSFGASKVKSKEALKPAIEQAFKHGSTVIIEEYLTGTEVTNGVYRNNGRATALAITEIVTENEFFDYKAKYLGESKEITPARISDEMTQRIKAETEQIYEHLNLEGVCRMDYMIQEGEPYLIEVNTVPGQSSASLIPQQIVYENLTLGEFYSTLLEKALASSSKL